MTISGMAYFPCPEDPFPWRDLCGSYDALGFDMTRGLSVRDALLACQDRIKIVLVAPREQKQFLANQILVLGADKLPPEEFVLFIGRDDGGFSEEERKAFSLEENVLYYTIPVRSGTALHALQAAAMVAYQDYQQERSQWQ